MSIRVDSNGYLKLDYKCKYPVSNFDSAYTHSHLARNFRPTHPGSRNLEVDEDDEAT